MIYFHLTIHPMVIVLTFVAISLWVIWKNWDRSK